MSEVSDRTRFEAVDPKCEYQSDPLGIDEPAPRFSWRIQAADRAQHQTAYRVLVSSSRAGLDAGLGDKWDSGKVASDATNAIAYAGAPLQSGRRYWWKAQTWDRDGRPGTGSPPATFETALMEPGDWDASWISGPPGVSAPLLRTETVLEAAPCRARCYMTGLGYYELFINGRRVGDQVLDPAITYYHNDLPVELGLAGPLRHPRRDPAPAGRPERGRAHARQRLLQRRGRRAALPQPPRALRRPAGGPAAARHRTRRGRNRPAGQRHLLASLGRADHLQRLQPRRDLRRPPGAARLVRAPASTTARGRWPRQPGRRRDGCRPSRCRRSGSCGRSRPHARSRPATAPPSTTSART